MIHIKRLFLSFGSAWVASILGLLVAGRFQEPVENFHSADPFGDSIRWGLLLAYFTLMCVGAAWVLVAIPYYFVFLRKCGKWPLIMHSLVAGVSGFLLMMIATQMLPVDDKSWRFTSPIAFVVGFFGAIMTRYGLFLPKTKPAEHVVGGNGG
jgi:hypothetical protein